MTTKEYAAVSSHLTPYNDSYETCERTLAALRIYADDLDPAAISARLGLQPTSFQTKGRKSTNSIGRTRTAPIGGWFLSSEGLVDSLDVRRHLDWLLNLLMPSAAGLLSLQTQEGIRMNVTCIWWSRGGGGPALWPKQMRGLADLNLECSFEISFYEDDPDAQ